MISLTEHNFNKQPLKESSTEQSKEPCLILTANFEISVFLAEKIGAVAASQIIAYSGKCMLYSPHVNTMIL